MASKSPEPPPAPSPQGVYDVFRDAIARKDAKTAVDCLAPEGRRRLLGELVYGAILARNSLEQLKKLGVKQKGPEAEKAKLLTYGFQASGRRQSPGVSQTTQPGD